MFLFHELRALNVDASRALIRPSTKRADQDFSRVQNSNACCYLGEQNGPLEFCVESDNTDPTQTYSTDCSCIELDVITALVASG